MALRVGLLDIVGAVIATVVIVLPEASKQVIPLYEAPAAARAPELAAAQAALARDPRDPIALARYTDLLVFAGQADQALRAAGAAAALEGPLRWRALLTVASVHADRLDAQEAHDWAVKALAECETPAATCPSHERLRIQLYVDALQAGLDSGIDPKIDPDGFKAALDSATPMIRVGGKRGLHPPK